MKKRPKVVNIYNVDVVKQMTKYGNFTDIDFLREN